MKIKALKSFITTAQGNFEVGDIKEVNDGYGRHLVEHGYAEQVKGEVYKTKVDQPVPLVESGTAKPSGASRQGRRSRKKIAKSSEAGESSPSTPASD